VIMDKDKWSLPQAKKWLKKHHLKTGVDEKRNTWRFRQYDPSLKKKYRSLTTSKGITFVLGISE